MIIWSRDHHGVEIYVKEDMLNTEILAREFPPILSNHNQAFICSSNLTGFIIIIILFFKVVLRILLFDHVIATAWWSHLGEHFNEHLFEQYFCRRH